MGEFGISSKLFSQFGGAELLAKKYKNEIIPLPVKKNKGDSPNEMHSKDEGIRATNYENIAKLKPMYKNGVITPASSSQIADGAAAIMVCNENGLKKLGLKPRAKISALAVVGSDPVIMLEGPVPATGAALKKAGLKGSDIDVVEVNEAFAPVPLAVAKVHFDGKLDKINVNGGAMALGHPLGCTGVKLMATLVNELEKRQGKYGLLAICEGGGTANATIIERVASSKL